MSAQIVIRDVQAGTEMAWHGLTKVVPVVEFQHAFPFELSRKPIYVHNGKLVKIADFSVFVSDDDGTICGRPMSDTYQAMNNARFWEVCNASLEGTGALVESAGTLNDRSRRFLTIKLSDDAKQIGHRTFKNRISFIDAIDGSQRFHAVNTSVCVVCANTARAAIGDKTGEFHFAEKHTKNFLTRIEGMEKQIELMVGVQAEFNAAMAMANAEPLAETGARNLFAGWIGEGATSLSTRAENTVTRLTGMFRSAAGNRGETLLDGISAITDFYSHESSGGEEKEGFRWKQYNSSEFGAGNRAKNNFISAMFLTESRKVVSVNTENIRALQSRGAALLAV